MDRLSLNATVRKGTGKVYSKTIRANGVLPAVMYNWKGEAEMLEVNEVEFTKVWKQATATTLINLVVDGKTHLAFIKDTEYDIVTDKNLHVDFHVIDAKKPLKATLKIQTAGNPVGVREGGFLTKGVPTVTIQCLPEELPVRIVGDVSNLGLNQSLLVKDLPFAKGIKIISDLDAVVAEIKPIR